MFRAALAFLSFPLVVTVVLNPLNAFKSNKNTYWLVSMWLKYELVLIFCFLSPFFFKLSYS